MTVLGVVARKPARRAAWALVVSVAVGLPLTLSHTALVGALAATAAALLVTRPGGGAAALGGLVIAAELGVAAGRSDAVAALAVAGGVGIAVVVLTASSPASGRLPAKTVAFELAIGVLAAAAASVLTGVGATTVTAGLAGTAVIIAVIAVRGRPAHPAER
jgi:hypothetical protein